MTVHPGGNLVSFLFSPRGRVSGAPRSWLFATALSALALMGCGSELRRAESTTCSVSSDCDSGLCVADQCIDPAADSDGDTLLNGVEVQLGSNPLLADSDEDGVADRDETDAQFANVDTDHDGVPNIVESATADTDGDCIPNQFDAQDTIANSDGCWQPQFVAPDEGAIVTQAAPVRGEVRVRFADGSVRAPGGFQAKLAIDGVVPSGAEHAVPMDGKVSLEGVALPGPRHLVVTVTDMRGVSREVARDIVVNMPPTAPEIAIAPTQPTAGDDLVAQIVAPPADTTFAPGNGLSYDYTWVRASDAKVFHGETLHADATTRGDVFALSVTADDGFGAGPAAHAEVTIGNSVPACDGAVLIPSATSTSQAINCRCNGWEDADGDADHSTCVFFDVASGTPIVVPAVVAAGAAEGSCTLPASATEKGMLIGCTLTPHDGVTAGTAVGSPTDGSVLILDSTPTTPSVALTPTAGDAEMEYACQLVTPSTDADGDSVTYEVTWELGDASTPATPMMTPAAFGAHKGDTMCCAMTASDGSQSSARSTPACVTLANAPPTLGSVAVTAASGVQATRRDVAHCVVSGASDADGDALTTTFEWYVGGAVVAGATTDTLALAEIAIGAVVSCGATVCDDEGACAALERSKTGVIVVNALPTIADVTIPDGDGHAQLEDVLTCQWSGWADPDGDPASVVVSWYVVHAGGATSEIAGAHGDTLTVDGSFAPGDEIGCRATPMNQTYPGATTDSDNRVAIVVPSPVAPTVSVKAPDGAEGTATCTLDDAGKWLPEGATWTWYWSVNGEAEVVGAQTREAGQISSCDLLRCRVAVTAPGVSLTSNVAALQMPLGVDCDDGNPCTSAVCFAKGGCNMVPQDGVACDDGDPCTDAETCAAGTCVGAIDLCTEDRVSVVGTATGRPALGAQANGGWAAQWFGAAAGAQWLRGTDRDETRIGTEQNAGAAGANYWNEPVLDADGNMAVLAVDPAPVTLYVTCGGCTTQAGVAVHLKRYDANYALVDDTSVTALAWAAFAAYPNWGSRFAYIGASKVQLVSLGGGTLGVLRAYENQATRTGLLLTPVRPDHSVAPDVTLLPAALLADHDHWDVASVPDGSNGMIVAWVGAGGKTVLAQRFSAAGVAEYQAPVTVATLANAVNAVRVTAFANGRFVVAWEGVGVDGEGTGIAAQRLDDQGSFVGDAFVLSSEVHGEQRLGDLASLATYQFVVTYRDASAPTAVLAARIFSSAAVGGERIIVNEASTLGSEAPSVVALNGTAANEWVASWTDAAGVVMARRYAADGSTAPRAAEFRANDETANTQETPSATSVGEGNVFVAYASKVYPSGPYATEIVTRVFDADGLELRSEEAANDFVTGAQTTPVVAGGADRVVVAWNSDGEDGSVDGLFARLYDGEGRAVSAPFGATVATADFQRQPAVAMAADGRWALAWNGASALVGSSSDVYLRVFPAGWPTSGQPSAEILVNTTTDGPQERPALALVPFADEVVVAWQSRNEDGSGYGIFVRKFGLDGTPKTPALPVNTTTAGDQRYPTVTVAQNGSVAVCWESAGQGGAGSVAVACQRLKTSNLTPQGVEFLPLAASRDQVAPTAKFLVSGRLAIAWGALGLDSDGFGVQLMRVGDTGQAVGSSLNVNRFWSGDQTRPWIVPEDDRLIVGWQSTGQDGAEGGVYFRILPMTP